MAQIITNQASLQYQYGDTNATVLSNIATAVLEQPLSVEKTSLRDEYRAGDTPTFVLRIVNSGNAVLNNVTVRDDLGTFTSGTVSVTPYAFLPDAILFVDGVNNGVLTPTGGEDEIVFTIPTLPADTTALIVYEVALTEEAPLAAGESITNTVTVTADGLTDSAQDSFTAAAAEYADVTITKTMTPSVVDGGRIVYTFDIENRGNAEAENIVLRDAFDPAPESITVAVNGTILPATEYSYTGGVLTVPGAFGTPLSLPAAQITRNPATGNVIITPSALRITVTGTL